MNGLFCRCPACTSAPLFGPILSKSFIKVNPTCSNCGLDLSQEDSGDGPAAFLIFVIGAFMVLLALSVDGLFRPPLWAHLLLWPPFIVGLTVVLLRPSKSLLISMQYHKKANQMPRTKVSKAQD